ncbi:zinc finger MYM-type protein 1-like [Helianthus annuus]|uniref:zinc finger MYM-type protein 1-like n=1 Tax=Helianthus annuus TaxID=4232 RepID=UPI000B8FC717|nr:zinc finger MYM-type protein 1-like [Helianthus annuus]
MYNRILSNRETCDREWLVYSKELDKVFCFCCKLFRQGYKKGGLDNEGYSDWKHASQGLKDHEVSFEHLKHMHQWFERRQRLDCNETIDKEAYEHFKKEKDYWKEVIFRIIALVKFLAKHGLAFCGSNEKLYQKRNGNFLGLVEMLEEFDPIMKEHVRCILNDELHIHYLGHNIQNELIQLLAGQVKIEIIKRIKQAKYYSIILDCTPDISHQEQMFIIVRYVNFNSSSVTVEESFLGFLVVEDTTGKGLFDVTSKELESLSLDIFDVRGQGYDNGANKKGKRNGVQSRFLEKNPRALYSACGCHSLNLVLWQILKDNVKGLTVKSLFVTRWESRVDSIKPIRTQLVEVRKALKEVSDSDKDPKIQSEARSLEKHEVGDYEFLTLDEQDLKARCYRLQDALKYKEESDVDAKELYLELKLIRTFLPSHIVSPIDALNDIMRLGHCPNAINAYHVLLTLSVTVASAERSFSKLKLLKSYLRSSMSQERLNGLAMISNSIT